VYKQKKKKKLV